MLARLLSSFTWHCFVASGHPQMLCLFCVSFNNLLISLSCRIVGKETALDS